MLARTSDLRTGSGRKVGFDLHVFASFPKGATTLAAHPTRATRGELEILAIRGGESFTARCHHDASKPRIGLLTELVTDRPKMLHLERYEEDCILVCVCRLLRALARLPGTRD